jgi:hypothetical protein
MIDESHDLLVADLTRAERQGGTVHPATTTDQVGDEVSCRGLPGS